MTKSNRREGKKAPRNSLDSNAPNENRFDAL